MNRLSYLSYSVILIICVFMFSGFTNAYTEYKIGDEVTYNNIKFYVIKNSGSDETSVTMLKAEPLTVEEVERYGEGRINKYSSYYTGQVYDYNGYGGMRYYSSEECGFNIASGNTSRGCTTDYEKSDIKYVVDNWAAGNSITNYVDIRLISIDDLVNNLGYELNENVNSVSYQKTEITSIWLYNANYSYWTMSSAGDSNDTMLFITNNGIVQSANIVYSYNFSTVRPVVTFRKQVLELEDIPNNNTSDNDETSNRDNESKIIDNNKEVMVENENNLEKNDSKRKNLVNVPNTFEKASIIFILIGVVLVSVSTIIVIKNKNKFNK